VANNTEEWWSIVGTDGVEVSLHQYGWSVTTVGGSRYDLPPRRGTDMTMAYRPGQVHRPKFPDARPITLVMFMVGWDPATGANETTAGEYQRLQWNDNWDALRRLVFRHWGNQDQRVRLTRRWRLTAPDFPINRNGDHLISSDVGVPPSGQDRIVSAFALAEMTGTMAPAMTGRFRSDFQLDFTLPDPYFYGSTVTVDMDAGDTTYVWNDGHDIAGPGYMEIDLKGPLDNPILYNLSTDPQSWVRYNGVIKANQVVRLVVNRFSAELLVDSGNLNRVGLISNYGARYWLNMLPGANKLRLTTHPMVETIVGGCEIRFRPPYV
jgi:hypothetical protein